MVIGATLMPTRISNFGVQRRRKLYSVQNSSIVRKPRGQAPFWLESSAQLCSVLCYSTLLWSAPFYVSLLWPVLLPSADSLHSVLVRHLWCFSSARETYFSVSSGKRKCAFQARGELAYIDRSHCF